MIKQSTVYSNFYRGSDIEMGKKYQVFISYTYTDLETEREKAINIIY